MTVNRLRVGDGWFDPVGGDLEHEGRLQRLRPRTAALFAHLLRHPDRVVSKDELMETVWPDVVVTEDSLVQCVKEIRLALGRSGRDRIRTVPRQGYAWVTPAAQPAGAAPRWRLALMLALLAGAIASLAVGSMHPVGAKKAAAPSIVVMPLVNRAQGALSDDAVDEVTERVTESLSRIPNTTVIASGTAFTFKGANVDARRAGTELGVRYVLEGSVRQRAGVPVLSVRLVDASNAAQLWSEEFAVREEVVARVANSLGLRLIRAEAARSQREHPQDPAAADLVTRALAVLRWSGHGQQGIAQARALLEQAVQRDPQLAEAWSMLVTTYMDQTRFADPQTRRQLLQGASDAAERAMTLAPGTAFAHAAKARVLYAKGGMMAQSLAEFDAALELSPNDPTVHGNRAAALVMMGRAADALPAVERAIELSPRDPQLSLWLMFQGAAYLHLGRDADAVKVLQRSVAANPSSAFGRLFLASALGSTGATAAAHEQVAELTRLAPGFTLTRMREREPSNEPAFRVQREHVYDGLRRAGLPE